MRREFIDPFFEALGWDVANKQGYAEAYKDVVHEETLKVGGGTKAPDYGFRIGGARKFFVEAKKPSVDIKEDVHPAYQLRRYAWSAKLPLSVLTDFEEFAVYDCRVQPHKSDKSSTARVMYVTFDQYGQRWDLRSPTRSARRSCAAHSTSTPRARPASGARLRWTGPFWPRSSAGATCWPAQLRCETQG